jgi:outer membrane murein-binding lipoprotein Lpp
MTDESPEVAAAIRELAAQVDALGNAMRYVADKIATAILTVANKN